MRIDNSILLNSFQSIFNTFMKFKPIRIFIESGQVEKGLFFPLSQSLLAHCYFKWYANSIKYNTTKYYQYQKRYWDTIGQLRWSDDTRFDYSDTKISLKKYIINEDQTLIDLGCGKGDMLQEIVINFPKLRTTGIDASKKMCIRAKNILSNTLIINDYYGPRSSLQNDSFDIVIARSTLTYIDEKDIENILEWISNITGRLLIISEPSGINDRNLLVNNSWKFLKINRLVYKRLHDHSHIRDYSQYKVMKKNFDLKEIFIEKAHNHGNKQWIFIKNACNQ